MPWEVFQEARVAYSVLAFLALAILVARAAPSERRTVLRTSVVIAFAVLCFFASGLFETAGMAGPAKYTRRLGVLLEGVGLIHVSALLLFRVVVTRLGFSPPRILQDVLFAVAVLVFGIVLLAENGVDITGIVTTSAVLTAVIGFSLQDTLGNILGGLALQVDQSIKVNDWIALDNNVVGRVVEVRWRYTSLETRDWETVVIPNGVLVKNRFMVLGARLGQPVQQRQWIPFNVDYDQPPVRVIETVNRAFAATNIPGVSKDPLPTCMLMDLTGSAARYAVSYYLHDLGAKNPTDSLVRVHICSALRRAGIPLAIPIQTVFVAEEAAEREREAQRETARRLAALRSSDLFDDLSGDEMRTLAEHLKPSPFSQGDMLMQQGAEAYWLYLITEGKADVFVENETHERAKVAELGPGAIIGEMGLMTGEPRTATVIAKTHVECYRLDKESFRGLLASRPELADEISSLLAKRRIELEATLDSLDDDAKADWTAKATGDLRQKIRQFFGLDD